VLPNGDYDRVDAAMRDAFCTSYKRGANVLQTSMANTNMVVHCIPMLMNAGRIEGTKGDFRFYFDGMPESVCRAMEAVDRERLAIAKAFGLDLMSTVETIRTQYKVAGDDLHSVILANPAFGGTKPDAPKTLDHRFLTEDTPFSMVPLVELGTLAESKRPSCVRSSNSAACFSGKTTSKRADACEDGTRRQVDPRDRRTDVGVTA
jgi:opine dehydrogenase